MIILIVPHSRFIITIRAPVQQTGSPLLISTLSQRTRGGALLQMPLASQAACRYGLSRRFKTIVQCSSSFHTNHSHHPDNGKDLACLRLTRCRLSLIILTISTPTRLNFESVVTRDKHYRGANRGRKGKRKRHTCAFERWLDAASTTSVGKTRNRMPMAAWMRQASDTANGM